MKSRLLIISLTVLILSGGNSSMLPTRTHLLGRPRMEVKRAVTVDNPPKNKALAIPKPKVALEKNRLRVNSSLLTP